MHAPAAAKKFSLGRLLSIDERIVLETDPGRLARLRELQPLIHRTDALIASIRAELRDIALEAADELTQRGLGTQADRLDAANQRKGPAERRRELCYEIDPGFDYEPN